MLTNPSFVILTLAYGINAGVYYAISTLLNIILLEFFPGEEVAIGWVGFDMVAAGLIGAVSGGFILMKTGKYRLTFIAFYSLCVVSYGVYVGSIYAKTIYVIYVTMFLLGFFQTGFLPIGFEFAAELTYPVAETLSCGLLNTFVQVFGIILTVVSTAIHSSYGSLAVNICLIVFLALPLVTLPFVKEDLRRLNAEVQVRDPKTDVEDDSPESVSAFGDQKATKL